MQKAPSEVILLLSNIAFLVDEKIVFGVVGDYNRVSGAIS